MYTSLYSASIALSSYLRAQLRNLSAAIATLHPDVVVIGGEAGPADTHVAAVRSADPALRVVSIDLDSRSATLYEVGVEPREVLNVSPDMLLRMICGRH